VRENESADGKKKERRKREREKERKRNDIRENPTLSYNDYL